MPKDLPQNKTLYWRVRAKSSDGVKSPWSEICSFTTGNPPSVPALRSPSKDALVKDYTPDLKWYPSKLPKNTTFLYYQIQVDDSQDFTTPLIDETTTATQYTPLSDLDPNREYFWRVRAFNDVAGEEHVSGWSKVWSFRTAMLPPTLLLPTDLSTVDTRKPTFDWEDVDGATSYKIQVSTSPSFGTRLLSLKVSISEFTPGTNLPQGKTLYWRVKALGPNGPSDWSDPFQFTVIVP